MDEELLSEVMEIYRNAVYMGMGLGSVGFVIALVINAPLRLLKFEEGGSVE